MLGCCAGQKGEEPSEQFCQRCFRPGENSDRSKGRSRLFRDGTWKRNYRQNLLAKACRNKNIIITAMEYRHRPAVLHPSCPGNRVQVCSGGTVTPCRPRYPRAPEPAKHSALRAGGVASELDQVGEKIADQCFPSFLLLATHQPKLPQKAEFTQLSCHARANTTPV